MQANSQTLIAFVAAMLLFTTGLCFAQPGVELSDGELVVDFAWADRANITLLVQIGDSYALRRLDIANDEISVIPVSGSFSRVYAQDEGAAVSLSPQGNAVAFLNDAKSPLGARDLAIYRLDPGGLETVNMRRIPADFLVDGYTWGPRGESVYVWARHYLAIEQPYSIGSVHLRSGMFTGIVSKDEIDLVEDVVFLPQREMLAVKCLGYMGAYPDSAMVVGLSKDGAEPSTLHGQAGHLAMNALASGELLLYEPGCGSNPFGNGECELWLLAKGKQELAKGKLPNPGVAQSVQATNDGGWIAYLQAVEANGAAAKQVLELRRISDSKTFSTKADCGMFRLSPWGEYVCATTPERDMLYFYPLTESR